MTESKADGRTAGVVILATLAVIVALFVGRELLVPVALGVLLCILLRPVVRALERLHLPTWLAAGVVTLGLLAGLIGIGFALAAPLRAWAAKAPENFTTARQKLERVREPIQKVTDAVRSAENAVRGPSSAPASQPTEGPAGSTQSTPPVPQPVTPSPSASNDSAISMARHLLGTTTQFIGMATEVVLLLLLLLASGTMFRDKLMRVISAPQNRQIAAEILDESAAVTLRYVVVTAMINAGQGVVVALVMWWLGMPTPWLWAIFTFVLEFVPYLGAMVVMALLGMTALASLDGLARVLMAPGSYLLITTLQNNLVSPVAYGNRLNLNPVAVLICVLFWYFVWGVPGAFMAVPITAMIKVLADRVGRLRVVAELLGE